jgi:hypothetical protein
MVSDPQKPVSPIVNDHIYNVLWGIVAKDGAFLCECGSPSCAGEVVMRPSEYVSLRGRGGRVYAPGHRAGLQAVSPIAS